MKKCPSQNKEYVASELTQVTQSGEKCRNGTTECNSICTHEEDEEDLILGRSGRRRCVKCYEQLLSEFDRNVASKKTPQSTLKCIACEKVYCLSCFFDTHKVSKKTFKKKIFTL